MKAFVNKTVSPEKFSVCLKMCVPELMRDKSFSERAASIVNYFDTV